MEETGNENWNWRWCQKWKLIWEIEWTSEINELQLAAQNTDRLNNEVDILTESTGIITDLELVIFKHIED